MMNRRCIAYLAGFSLLLAPVGAGAAAGDGIQMGPVLLYPVLSIAGTHDDNIGLAANAKESGWITTIAPSLQLTLPVRRFFLNVNGGLEFLSYSQVEQSDSTDWFVGAAAGAEFPGGLSFKIADKHWQRSLIATQEYGVAEDNSVNTLTATVAYAVRNALRLEFSGQRLDSAFSISEKRDRVETTVGIDVFWKLRPAVSALVGASYAMYQYDSNTAQDSTATQVGLGMTWDVTAKSSGNVKAGYQWKRFDTQDAALGTDNAGYFTLSAGLRHAFTTRTALDFEVSRASMESDFPENPYFVRTAVDAKLTQRFTRKFFGRVGVRYGSDDYPNATSYDNPYDTAVGAETGERTDTTLGGSVSLGFDATRWLAFELSVGAENRDSSFDTFDYDSTRVTLGAKAAF